MDAPEQRARGRHGTRVRADPRRPRRRRRRVLASCHSRFQGARPAAAALGPPEHRPEQRVDRRQPGVERGGARGRVPRGAARHRPTPAAAPSAAVRKQQRRPHVRVPRRVPPGPRRRPRAAQRHRRARRPAHSHPPRRHSRDAAELALPVTVAPSKRAGTTLAYEYFTQYIPRAQSPDGMAAIAASGTHLGGLAQSSAESAADLVRAWRRSDAIAAAARRRAALTDRLRLAATGRRRWTRSHLPHAWGIGARA